MKVSGYCPMGCGETLFLGEGGHVTCSLDRCPDPGAVATILDEPETEHIVWIGPDGFTVKHPLRERREDELAECELHLWLKDLDEPPAEPGTYRVMLGSDEPDDWRFVETERAT